MTMKDTTEVDQAIKKAIAEADSETIILVARNIADPDSIITMIENGEEGATDWKYSEFEEALSYAKANHHEVCTVESVWDMKTQRYHSITSWYRKPIAGVAGGAA